LEAFDRSRAQQPKNDLDRNEIKKSRFQRKRLFFMRFFQTTRACLFLDGL
jgi:hypothetical protein